MNLRRPDDFHVHLRQAPQHLRFADDALRAGFKRVLAMPNTLPPLVDAQSILAYKADLEAAAPGLEILSTFKIRSGLGSKDLSDLAQAGVRAGKFYPEGVTTHSEDGIKNLVEAWPIFEAMQEQDMVLCLHGEDPQAFSLDREKSFLTQLERIVAAFPRLRIVLEHVSTAEGVEAVKALGPKVGATVTVHHLLYVFDDLIGAKFNPHLFCKPLLKRAEDREALQEIVLAGHERFFFGSDSAPHSRSAKEGPQCAAGVYSMPVSLPLLAAFFDAHGRLNRLEPFVSEFGARFYGLALNKDQLRLEKKPWTVPAEYHGVVPLATGQDLEWKVIP